ncbi:MAG: hypothetical protein JWR04_2596 [Rhodoglobus sp.]|nr:hypothetical protein [Rhodoglobus sp.]
MATQGRIAKVDVHVEIVPNLNQVFTAISYFLVACALCWKVFPKEPIEVDWRYLEHDKVA